MNVRVWEPTPQEWEDATALIPTAERDAVMRFMKEIDRKRALMSRLLQRLVIARAFHLAAAAVEIRRTKEGKPYWTGQATCHFPNFNFNATHHGR